MFLVKIEKKHRRAANFQESGKVNRKLEKVKKVIRFIVKV